MSKIAPARILADNERPKVGWLVEGQFDLVDGGSPAGRFFFGVFGAGQSFLALHVKVTDVVSHRVIYEFDMAGGSNSQGKFGTVRASGMGKATPFDLRNAAERILLVLSPDAIPLRRAQLGHPSLGKSVSRTKASATGLRLPSEVAPVTVQRSDRRDRFPS